MKKVLLSLTLVLAAVAFTMAQKQQVAPTEKAAASANGPKIEFEVTTIDYGTIDQGADPYRTFKFKNTGNQPLVIKNAKGSCGCTVPTYPKEPVMPGEGAEIKVRYDTNRPGPINKRVTLTTNINDEEIVLTITGKVEPKAAEPSGVPAGDGNMFKNQN